MYRLVAMAGAVAALGAGCASRGSVEQLDGELRALQAEVTRLRQSQENLSWRLTEVGAGAHATQTTTADLQSAVAANAAAVQRLAAKLDATEAAVKDVKDAMSVAATPPPPAPAAQDPPKESRAGSAEHAYASAEANFRKGEYGQAVLDFLEVVTKHPAHPLAATAQYWIGEAYFRQHDYRQALVEFQRV